jgi:hypothetical protein
MRPDIDRLAREDLAMFINACFACTGQAEYYADSRGQDVAIQFLHEYILGNYRRLYARTLAAGINHFNQSLIIANLLAQGAPRNAADREEEGALLSEALRRLPASRAWRLVASLRDRRINNRRTRAIVREFFELRRDVHHDAVKYRPRMRAAARHAHCPLPDELPIFLFGNGRRRKAPYATPLFEAHRRARTEPEALYELPYTVAEGFAARHRIPREVFLQRIEARMTPAERLRLQSAARAEGASIALDLHRIDLTRVCLYVLSLPVEERLSRATALRGALAMAADRVVRRAPMQLGRVAAVLDRSHSSAGSHEKARRPLAVALGVAQLLEASAREFRAFWSPPFDDALTVEASGQTDLATPLVDALEGAPDLVVIVSDGFENSPRGGVAEVMRHYRQRVAPGHRVSVVHVNPVFDQERFAPRALAPGVATVGLRDAEDLFTMLGFARFAEGSGTLAELEAWLLARVRRFLAVRARRDDAPELSDAAQPLDDEALP